MRIATPAPAYAGPHFPASQGVFSRLGFFLLAPFVFFLYSRVLDVAAPQLHLPLILGTATLGALLLSGGLFVVVRMLPARLMLLFTAWFCLAGIFSIWRGGSFQVFRDYWIKSLIIFLAISGLVVTLERMQVLIRLIAAGIALAMVIALAAGATDLEGRLRMESGEFANSNALGMFAVLGLPFCWHAATSPGGGRLTTLWSALAAIPMFHVVSRSGSRTALLMLGALVLYAMCRFTVRQRLLFAGVAVPVALVSFVTAPEALLNRFSTVFVTGSRALEPEASDLEESAVASTEARLYLLRMSLWFTARYPLLGVGPGQFMVAEAGLREQAGRRGTWLFTHNGFTQISSETGVPGFLFYAGALVSVWRSLRRLSKGLAGRAGAETPRHAALTFQLLFPALLIGVFFGISLYQYFVPAFMGLILGFVRSADADPALR